MKFTSEDLLKAMGLKIGDIVKVGDTVCELVYSAGSYLLKDKNKIDIFVCVRSLESMTNVEYQIIQPKSTLTEDEKVVLRNIDSDCLYIARHKHCDYVTLFYEKPTRNLNSFGAKDRMWNLPFYHLFQFIKWEDEPYSIEELLKE